MDFSFFLDAFNQASGVIGAVSASLAWLEVRGARKSAAQKITIKILIEDEEGREIELPLEMRRGDLSRAELLGRLGMIPMIEKGKRFSIKSLFSLETMKGINAVVDGKTSTLVIPCTRAEFDQFDLSV